MDKLTRGLTTRVTWPLTLAVNEFNTKPSGAVPTVVVQGTLLRGYVLTAVGTLGQSVQWQEQKTADGAWTNVTLPNPFTVGNGSSSTGKPGRRYRASVVFNGVTYTSDAVGPVGISDLILPDNNAYFSVRKDKALLNTDGVGYNAGYVRGVDYAETMSFYEDTMGADARLTWDLAAGVATPPKIFCYNHFCRNRYTDESAAQSYDAGVALSNLSAQVFTWDLTEAPASDDNRSFLIEYYPSDNANLVAPAVAGVGGNRQAEFGVFPFISPEIRSYFTTAPNTVYPDYIDENGLTWEVRGKAGPSSVLSGRQYVVAMAPSGVTRLSGSFRLDRYSNWKIAQNIASGSWYMTGLAAGLEINSDTAGGAGMIEGQFFPDETQFPWSGVAAVAHSFDTDVSSYFSRFTSLPGIEVRKAVDAFILGLKADGLYSLIDDMYFPRAAGLVDVRRAFKSSSRDIIDRVGTAAYVAKQGLTYAGAGYGGTQFNPSTAGGQFAQNDAFMFGFIEADTGAVSASHFGNAGARFGRTTNGLGISHQLNNASASFLGTNAIPEGWSIRRKTGALPSGTGGSAAYQVKKASTSTTHADVTATVAALTNAEIELFRAGSGSVYSSAVMSFFAFGGGLTNVQMDALGSRVLSLRTALAAAGV